MQKIMYKEGKGESMREKLLAGCWHLDQIYKYAPSDHIWKKNLPEIRMCV